MWIFAGFVVLAAVAWYWLRKIARALLAMGAVHEATVNRAASLRGDPPVTTEASAKHIFD